MLLNQSLWGRTLMCAALLLLAPFSEASAQFNPDDYCVQLGDPFPGSVLDNDEDLGIPSDMYTVVAQGLPDCFYMEGNGVVQWNPMVADDCCGDHSFFYLVYFQDELMGEAEVHITVKCDKPNCAVISLEDWLSQDPAGDGSTTPGDCIPVCEFSQSTISWTYDPLSHYEWNTPGGYLPGAHDAEIVVDWGVAGASWVELTITDGAGNETTYLFCIDILEGPDAAFTSTGYACLGAPMTFENLFPYAASYTWDFGDLSTLNDDSQFVNHTYTAPGTYLVVLTATTPVYGEQGEALCCCTQQFSMEVIVDDLPGPEITCVSTLCEGDEASYTTNATGCASYFWTVTDADGNPVVFSGQGTPNITVVWGAGPFGTVTLDADGCDDDYCDNPSSVTIPIIGDSNMFGADIVCAGATETYAVPKWLTADYVWNVVGGTIIENNGHTITVAWGSGPVGSVDVIYDSGFLTSLEGHLPGDCGGSAGLSVSILPPFELTNYQPQVCLGSSSTIYATASPSTAYTWNIDPAVPFLDNGDNIVVDWSVPAGVYTVTAISTDGAYCNTEEVTYVQVVEILPPVSITGPDEICPGETVTYVGVAGQPGTTLFWNVSGGSPTFGTGTSIAVTWDASGTHLITLSEQMTNSPYCVSDAISVMPEAKSIEGPLAITGSANCTNSIESYVLSPSQHADALIEWRVDPATDGSVVAGQGTTNVDIQWNNDAGPTDIIVDVTLCGVTQSVMISPTLVSPVVPVIQQTGNLCPGGSASLETTVPFVLYDWSTGDGTPTTGITSPGLYSVTTTDGNNCEATSYYTAIEHELPVASISTPDPETICIDSPHTVTLVAFTGPDYEFTWYCDGILVQGPGPLSNYTHVFQGTPGTYVYHCVVQNTLTLCTETSNYLSVVESDCVGGGPCIPEPYSIAPTAVLGSPDCNQVQFGTAGFNFTPTQWYFDDGNTSGAAAPLHTYTTAACYNVTVKGLVPSTTGGFCEVQDNRGICVPLAADFSYEITDCREVTFTNLSTYLGAPYGTAIASVLWDFGGPTSATYDPTYTFPGSGTFPVSLTVYNSSGCEATIVYNVVVSSVGVPTATASDLTPCVGEAVTFNGSASGAVSYTWNFGDGATFVGNPALHTYEADGPFTVTLTVADAGGCTDQTTLSMNVHPAIPAAVITGPDVVCAGDLAMLSAPIGYTYVWSNGDLTQTVNVGAGTYSVILTDANMCTLELDAVTVTELPLPPAAISGDAFVCDAGCVDLTTAFVSGATYHWEDSSGNPIGFGSGVTVCDTYPLPETFQVTVTDTHGCVNVSDPFTVSLAASPVVSITNVGSGCAGDPNELTVAPVTGSQSVLWSTGQNTETIIASAAGDYTAVVTDLDSGCQGSATATINPLPDLCSIPVGCYSDCDSTEVCALPGLGIYQWNLNGLPIPGATYPCYMITVSGIYSLTITSPDGCTDTSGDLEMMIEPCGDCDDVHLTYTEVQDADGNCCIELSSDVNHLDVYSLQLLTSDADFSLDLGSVDPGLSIQTNTSGEIRFAEADPTQVYPQGILSTFATVCLENATVSPQWIYYNWLDNAGEVVCLDSLQMNCPVEPDCVYLLSDSVYCENGVTTYDFTICNPADNPYSIGYIDLIELIAPITMVPSYIDLTGLPILPGTCRDLSVTLTGATIDGELFCYSLIAHADDPALDPTTWCCSMVEEVCIEVPICDPCELVHIDAVLPTTDEDCCYQVQLYNGYSDSYFDQVSISVISPLTTFVVDNPIGSGWFTSGYTGTTVDFIPDGSPNNFAPLGVFSLPEICVETGIAPNQEFIVQWFHNGEVVCEERFEVFCEPPCGYINQESIVCDPTTGEWIVNLGLQNTSDWTVSEAVISFPSGSPYTAYNETIALGSVLPGTASGIFNFNIGAPAVAGEVICFTVTIHEVSSDGLYLSCCSFTHCVTLPSCDQSSECACDQEFEAALEAGLACSDVNGLSASIFLADLAAFNPNCDQVKWSFGDGTSTGWISPYEVQTHIFPAAGDYVVCVKLLRITDDGEQCGKKLCKTVSVDGSTPMLQVFPNPSSGNFTLRAVNMVEMGEGFELIILDPTQREVYSQDLTFNQVRRPLAVDLDDVQYGVYIVVLVSGDQRWTERVLITP